MPTTEPPAGTGVRAAVVTVASLLSGAATFVAQDLLPAAVSSFANSASGWTLVTVLLLAWARLPTVVTAVLGAASFVLLTLGYTAAARLADLSYDPTLFGVVGLVVGPCVGTATAWLRSPVPWQTAGATGLLAGIGLGEAVYGLTAVADTTSPVYWLLVGAVALGLLVAMLVRRIHGVRWSLLAVAGTAAVAGAFVVAYTGLGGA